MVVTKEVLEHISTKPWSDFTEADYTLEQWHAACLIHLHTGPPTSKAQCKLPIKTPTGAVNQNGVFAAAAALAGARGGVNAPESEKASAAKTLIRLYGQMNKKPPPSLMQHSDDTNNEEVSLTTVEDILEHHGIKGMHWGIRRDKKQSTSTTSEDFRKAQELRRKNPSSLTNQELQTLNQRLNLERQHKQLNPGLVHSGKARVEFILGTVGLGVTAYKLVHSDAFKAVMNIGKKTASKQLKFKF